MRTTYFIWTLLLLSGCCTKKKCEDRIRPAINISFNNFTPEELLDAKLFAIDVQTKNVVYSYSNIVSFASGPGTTSIQSEDVGKEMRDMFFVIQTPATSDTIYNVSYEIYSYKIKCNACFPFGNQKINVTAFRDFSFYYKGQQYFADALTISK